VAKELGKIDLELLTQEVKDLREQLEVTVRGKLRAERTNAAGTSAANRAFETARSAYLAKARKLQIVQRRLSDSDLAREPGADESAVESTPGALRVVPAPSGHQGEPRPSAAAIGSIDMDAVFKRSEKVMASHKELDAARLSHKKERMRMQSHIKMEVELLSKLSPGSEDYRKHEIRVTDLKARYEAARENAEREFARRQSAAAAILYKEIQDTVAALAKTKWLTYVVRVAPGPQPDADHSEVSSALHNSVVYADPGNDITEEVIDALNRRFRAGGAKASRSHTGF